MYIYILQVNVGARKRTYLCVNASEQATPTRNY